VCVCVRACVKQFFQESTARAEHVLGVL
jgi:hypothetical protein